MRNPTRFIGLSMLALLTAASLGGVAAAKGSADLTDSCIRSLISCGSDNERSVTDPYIRSLVKGSDDKAASASDPYVRSLISPDANAVRVVTLPQRTEKVVGDAGWGEEVAGGLAGVTLGMVLMGTAFLVFGKRNARSAL